MYFYGINDARNKRVINAEWLNSINNSTIHIHRETELEDLNSIAHYLRVIKRNTYIEFIYLILVHLLLKHRYHDYEHWYLKENVYLCRYTFTLKNITILFNFVGKNRIICFCIWISYTFSVLPNQPAADSCLWRLNSTHAGSKQTINRLKIIRR